MSSTNRVNKTCRIYIKENFTLHLEAFLIIFIDIFCYSKLPSACITHLKYHHTDLSCSPTLLQSATETNKWYNTGNFQTHQGVKSVPGSAEHQGQMEMGNQNNSFGAGDTATSKSQKEA